MRRTSIVAAAIGSLLVASSSFAGFTVTAAAPVSSGGFDRYDITAVNTGGDTGNQIKGLEYFYQGSPAAFEVTDTSDPGGGDPDGIADTVNLLSTSRTRIRVSTTGANNVFVGVSPTNEFAQPNPYAAGAAAFQGAIANTGSTNASGAGFQIARIFLPTGGSGVFSGNIGGDIGTKVPFSVQLGGGTTGGNTPPVVAPGSSAAVVFGQIVTNGAPFSVQVTVTDTDTPAQNLSLTVPALAGLSNIVVSPAQATSPATFTITGTVDYSLNGQTVTVPVVASDGTATGNGSFQLVVTPEPTSLALVGLSTLLLGRRRK